jgi:hypothetical protein
VLLKVGIKKTRGGQCIFPLFLMIFSLWKSKVLFKTFKTEIIFDRVAMNCYYAKRKVNPEEVLKESLSDLIPIPQQDFAVQVILNTHIILLEV